MKMLYRHRVLYLAENVPEKAKLVFVHIIVTDTLENDCSW